MTAERHGAFLCREPGTHFFYSNDAIGGCCVLYHHMAKKISIRFGIF